MARREIVTDRNDTNVRSRNTLRTEETPAGAAPVPAMPERFRTERVGEFVSRGRSTIAPTGEPTRAMRRAQKTLAARQAGYVDRPGFRKPGSQKKR